MAVLFFGYGANKSREKITEIIGRDPGEGTSATLDGYDLCYQSLTHIPEPPRNLLTSIWGSNFKAYTLHTGNGQVFGIIWKLSDDEFQKVKEWEFIGVWRELLKVTVKTADGTEVEVFTEKAPDDFPADEKVNGLEYSEFVHTNIADEKIKDAHYTQQQLQTIRQELQKFSQKP